MLRIIHTADWHLGHSLHGVSRDYEHQAFLDFLLDTLAAERAHVLLVAGDVFDSANPPAAAQRMFYRFLAEAHRRLPRLQTLIIAGNHDSAARLEAPRPLLEAMQVTVVGSLPRRADAQPDPERLLVGLRDDSGQVAAWCAAVPYLRPADLPAAGNEADPLIAGVEQVYGQALDAARQRCGPGQALLATGHCYMAGGQLSELSERRILGGNQHALPVSIFPGDVDYLALGHLHRAQSVGGRDRVRYAGSPLPLSLDERGYRHQLLRVDVTPGTCRIQSIPVPRCVQILRLPATGAAPPEAILGELTSLQLEDLPAPRQPFLELRVRLDAPSPDLRSRVEQALEGRPVRLLKLGVEYAGGGSPLADALDATGLAELSPDQVFRRCYQASHEGEPSPELTSAFHELLGSLHEDPEDQRA